MKLFLGKVILITTITVDQKIFAVIIFCILNLHVSSLNDSAVARIRTYFHVSFSSLRHTDKNLPIYGTLTLVH